MNKSYVLEQLDRTTEAMLVMRSNGIRDRETMESYNRLVERRDSLMNVIRYLQHL